MLLYMPTAGKNKLNAALASNANPKITIGSFRIGEDIGFTPNPSYGIPEPFSVYTGSSADMRGWYVTPYYLAIQCVLPHNVGDFDVGNVVIYDTAGVPIVGGVGRAVQRKYASVSGSKVGNHLVLTLGLRSATKRNIASALLLSGLGANYAATESVDTEQGVTEATLSRISLLNIDTHSSEGRPVVAFKVPQTVGADLWMGVAMYDKTDAAALRISGGSVGDGYD